MHENNEDEIRLKPLERYDKEAVFGKLEQQIGEYLRMNRITNYRIYLSEKEPVFDKSGKFKEIFQV